MQKLTNKEEEIMQILWKPKLCKEVMAEITEDQPHYKHTSTIVRNLKKRVMWLIMRMETRISTTLLFLLKTIENAL
jgi:predicted transcriptional regulator